MIVNENRFGKFFFESGKFNTSFNKKNQKNQLLNTQQVEENRKAIVESYKIKLIDLRESFKLHQKNGCENLSFFRKFFWNLCSKNSWNNKRDELLLKIEKVSKKALSKLSEEELGKLGDDCDENSICRGAGIDFLVDRALVVKEVKQRQKINVENGLKKQRGLFPVSPGNNRNITKSSRRISYRISQEVLNNSFRVLQDLNTNFRYLSRFFKEQNLLLKSAGGKAVQEKFKTFFCSKTPEERRSAKIRACLLKEHLMNKYTSDFQADGWHGYTSLGRIIWQDKEFIRMITAHPLVLVAFILDDMQLSEQSLGGILLAGPGRQELAYLATVAPNWMKEPQQFTWNLGAMMLDDPITEETPFQPNLEFLNQFQKMMNAISKVVGPKSLKKNSISPSIAWVEKASISELLAKYKKCVTTTDLATQITYSTAGDSTLPWNMAEQCFEVMCTYEQIYQHHKSDTASMGYGLVSHALDARHLAAALYFINNQESLKKEKYWGDMYHENKKSLRVGIENFSRLIERMQTTTSSSTDGELFKIRLQQLLKIVISKEIDIM